MRQHVNPLSKQFKNVKPLPSLEEIFKNPDLPLHIDFGCGAAGFLINLASENPEWNYLGIEIREKLVTNASKKIKEKNLENLYLTFANAENLIKCSLEKLPKEIIKSVSFNFPDPWFKKKHHKRRILQKEFIINLSSLMPSGSLISIKSDVEDLYDHMDSVISDILIFKKLAPEGYEYSQSFNPKNLKTEREIYAISNKLLVHEQIYMKI
tara:strand:- start:51 stop:680 length:630 start_codon:yes stop_codon:yes gene_type:complete